MTTTIVVAEKASPPPPPPAERVKPVPQANPDHATPPSSVAPPVHEAMLPSLPAPSPPAELVKPAPQANPDHAAPPNSLAPPVQGAILEAPNGQQTTPNDRERLFVEGYGGGDCFLVKPLPDGGGPAYLGVGDQLGPFQRFEEAFKREVGTDPQLSLRLITAAECPALDLFRPGIGEASGVPSIELIDYRVGRNRPLVGTIANLHGRNAFLILVDNDGVAYRLDVKPEPGGDAAKFSVPLTPDAGSAKQLQVILAIASSRSRRSRRSARAP